ncbi:hypothetical protein DID96_37040 [Burkholderia sp. Bp8963]|uniref:hypothetical protein n=1 Tax=Burkholderia sp. Bp8963 TaxID=2184547 RepID=UPI000F5A3ED0|nr:hypothetical protein [Burkholderia sp. Bp8963]RQS56877.1 hypothetical protein DID96_37040 [Burkholderia sp. Bp8963]
MPESQFSSQFIADLTGFMRDCRFRYDESRSFSNIMVAIAYAYRPHVEFWERLDLALVVTALESYLPNRASDNADDTEFLHERIADHIYMRQHDEHNAAMLAALPPESRPVGAAETADWICAELERKGDIESFEYAERDGRKCGEAALIHLAVMEALAKGQTVLDPDAEFAHELRAKALAGAAKHTARIPVRTATFDFE